MHAGPGTAAGFQGHHEGEDPGHGVVHIGGNLLADLAGRVQGSGQGDVLHDRHPVGVGLLTNAGGHVAESLGDDPRR